MCARATGTGGVTAYEGSAEVAWNAPPPPTATGALPLLDIAGSSVTTDGSHLVGRNARGQPLGPDIAIVPALGPTWSTAATHNNVLVLATRVGGSLAAYLTNGIPHASFVLNGTAPGGGGPGFYTALGPPLVENNRLYIATAFRLPNGQPPPGAASCRVYAIDVARTLNHRLRIGWWTPVPCPAASTAPAEGVPAPPVPLIGAGGNLCLATAAGAFICLRDNGTHALAAVHLALPGRLWAAAAAPLPDTSSPTLQDTWAGGNAAEKETRERSQGRGERTQAMLADDDDGMVLLHVQSHEGASLLLRVNASSGVLVGSTNVSAALHMSSATLQTTAPLVVTICSRATGSDDVVPCALSALRNGSSNAAPAMMAAWDLSGPPSAPLGVLWTVALPSGDAGTVIGQALPLMTHEGDATAATMEAKDTSTANGPRSMLLVPTLAGAVFLQWN